MTIRALLRLRAAAAVYPSSFISVEPQAPIVSFTFDDFPRSALDAGGRLLEASGCRGTYYAAFGLAGQARVSGAIGTPEQLASSHGRGHELGCHTYSHLGCSATPAAILEADIRRNIALAESFAAASTNFAYPYGDIDRKTKAICRRYFRSARGVGWGVERGLTDLFSLKGVPIYSRHGIDFCKRYVDQISRQPAWLIFYTHDVSAQPSDYGCAPGELEQLLEYALTSGATVATVDQALTQLGAPACPARAG